MLCIKCLMHCTSGHCALHCPSGAMLCSAPLGLYFSLPRAQGCALCVTVFRPAPLSCVLHCSSGLCSALPLWGYALHCPSGVVLNTASFRLQSVLPLWAVLCTAPMGLCPVPQGHCALPCLGHCASALHCTALSALRLYALARVSSTRLTKSGSRLAGKKSWPASPPHNKYRNTGYIYNL